MAEIQRPRRALFVRITAGRDVLEVQHGRAAHHLGHRGEIPIEEGSGMLLEEFEEPRVPDQSRLDRLRCTAAPVAVGQRREKTGVVDDRTRRRKRPEIVLLPERVDAVFHAHRRVVLREHRGRDTNQTNTPVGGCRRETGSVEHRASADRNQIGMPAERGGVDRFEDAVHVAAVVLDGLAAGDDQDRHRQRHDARVLRTIRGNRLDERRMRALDAAVDNCRDPRRRVVLSGARRDQIAQQRVRRRKDTGREVHRIADRNEELLLDDVHHHVTENSLASEPATSAVASTDAP
jgi:hypothetical protein